MIGIELTGNDSLTGHISTDDVAFVTRLLRRRGPKLDQFDTPLWLGLRRFDGLSLPEQQGLEKNACLMMRQ